MAGQGRRQKNQNSAHGQYKHNKREQYDNSTTIIYNTATTFRVLEGFKVLEDIRFWRVLGF